MRATGRNRMVTVQRATFTTSPTNSKVAAWATYHEAMADKLDLSNRERVAVAEIAADVTTRFRLLWTSVSAGITPKDRVVCEGRTYDIKGVREIGFHEGVEIDATARADQ